VATALLQIMEQCMITDFKHYHCENALTQAVIATEGDSDTVLNTFEYKLTCRKQLTSLREVLNVVSQNCISNIKKIFCTQNFKGL
jgi:hypothetical protein